MPECTSISILIPTYNEADNIAAVLSRIKGVLTNFGVIYEILVIDDASIDNTAVIAESVLGQDGRVIRRNAQVKGLAESVLDGIAGAKMDAIVVMDADLSHPPELIPQFIQKLNQGYDLIIASRYVPGGGTENFPLLRRLISRFACLIGRLVTDINDNTSGFFCLKKSALDNVILTPRGFKIGLEIFVRANFKHGIEIPFIFADRKKGKSKLKSKQIAQYVLQVLSLLHYRMFKISGSKGEKWRK